MNGGRPLEADLTGCSQWRPRPACLPGKKALALETRMGG